MRISIGWLHAFSFSFIMMEKTQVNIVFLGSTYYELDRRKVTQWKSELFAVNETIGHFPFPQNVQPVTDDWEYTDRQIESILAKLPQEWIYPEPNANVTFYVVDVAIENDDYSHIISHNRILVTYKDVKEILHRQKIPQENYLLMLIYCYVLLLKTKQKGENLTSKDESLLAHYACTGCLYDYCADKEDIGRLCHKPHLCEECYKALADKGALKYVKSARKELKHIRRHCFDSVILFIQTHKVLSLILSTLLSLAVSVLGSIIVNS